jgi:hypothetical protein
MPPRPGPVCELAGGGPSPDHARARPGRNPGFNWVILQRHGRRPLAVPGRVLLQGDNRCTGLPWWSAITIYETDPGPFAVALCHTPPEQAGPAWHDAWLADSAETLRATLQRHDPLAAMPAGLQASIRSGLRVPPDTEAAGRFQAAWAGLLGALFGLRPPLGARVEQAAPA